MVNVVAYCRVSTDEKDQLNSLQTQKEFFETYASQNNMNLIHIYSDQGISGTKTKNRAAFNQMMLDAESHTFSVILIKDISRLARNTVVLLESCRKLHALGIEIRFINNKMTNLGNSEFLMSIFGAMAQEESYNTSIRIKFSKKFNAKKGKIPNYVFGYDKTNGDYFHLNINAKEAGIVRNIFEWYITTGDGTLKIAQKLNAMGILTKRGSNWTQTSVSRILSNALYTGKVINGKEEIVNFPESIRKKKDPSDYIIVQNEELRIIDDETFEAAQSILLERQNMFHLNNTRHSNQYLFSTLIKCKECGWSFRRVAKTYKNTYIRWVCSGRNGNGRDTCENTISIDEEILITEIQKYFSSLLKDKESYAEKAKESFRKEYAHNKETDKRREEIQKELNKMKKIKEKMILLYAEDSISLDEFHAKTEQINTDIPRLEHELQTLTRFTPNNITFEKAMNTVFKKIENITDVRALSNTQLKEIIREITVDKDGHIDIYLNVLHNKAE